MIIVNAYTSLKSSITRIMSALYPNCWACVSTTSSRKMISSRSLGGISRISLVSCWAALLVRLPFPFHAPILVSFVLCGLCVAVMGFHTEARFRNPLCPFCLPIIFPARSLMHPILIYLLFICNHSSTRPQNCAYRPEAREYPPCTQCIPDVAISEL